MPPGLIRPGNCVGLWRFDGNALDSTGNVVAAATLYGDAAYATGRFGQGLSTTPGGSGYARVTGTQFPSKAATWGCWAKSNAIVGALQRCLSYGNNGLFVSVDTSSNVPQVNALIGGTLRPLLGTYQLKANKWYWLVGTYGAGDFRFYIDGTLDAQTTAYSGNLTYTSSNIFFNTNPLFTAYMNGITDEIFVCNDTWASERIKKYYNSLKGVF